jgi:hypothetical protein
LRKKVSLLTVSSGQSRCPCLALEHGDLVGTINLGLLGPIGAGE